MPGSPCRYYSGPSTVLPVFEGMVDDGDKSAGPGPAHCYQSCGAGASSATDVAEDSSRAMWRNSMWRS